MSRDDIDRLAGVLFEAYEPDGDGWDDLKARYPLLAEGWHRVARAAIDVAVAAAVRTIANVATESGRSGD